MKKTTLGAWITALALAAAGFMPLAPAFSAQTQSPMPNAQPQQQQPQQQSKTYLGEIVKTQSGKYGLLTDKQAGKGYYLDDQEDAKKYDQQNVLVTGTLDPQTKTLHVSSIKPAPHQ